jgi:DIS3-like exonuclease 2
VEWEMNESGEIESTWFGRSIIKSCSKLAYEHAQLMIDNPGKSKSEPGVIKCFVAVIDECS